MKWRDIPGWEGAYAVSDAGDVASLDRSAPGRRNFSMDGRRLNLSPNTGSGYARVRLSLAGKNTNIGVHRLVLFAFVGPCPPGMEACHGNGDRLDNRLGNLRWDTKSANTRDQVTHGTHVNARKTECPLGHPFDSENTYLYDGRRQCKTCRRTALRLYDATKRAATRSDLLLTDMENTG